MTRRTSLTMVVLLAVITTTEEPSMWPCARPLDASQAGAPDVAAAIGERLTAPSAPAVGSLSASDRDALTRLYGSIPAALWTNSNGRLTGNAKEALALLEDALTHGLNPADYGANVLAQLAGRLDAELSRRPAPPAQVVDFDVAMSAAALRYFRHLHLGRVDPRSIGWRLDVPVEQHDMATVLRTALAESRIANTAASLVPPLAQYGYLRGALARYRALALAAQEDAPPDFSAVVRPGDPVPESALRALTRRLALLRDLHAGDASASATGRQYSEPLAQAVRRFQLRHGLEPDGVIGVSTLAALRVPITWRVRQIELALERLRWLPDLANERVIALNIPMFHLWAWSEARPDGIPDLGMRAIVGRAVRTRTPVLTAELREVILRPYWNVPRSILMSEVLPDILRDRDYLARENMEIVRGAGDQGPPVPPTDENIALLQEGVLRLRQRPGPRNALGLIKFEFPNNDNVYLHGTPAQELFARTRRDFSHGCVRVEDPVALAEWVLKGQDGWTRDRIVATTSGTATRRLAVIYPVQLVLFYLTAAVFPDDRTVHFAEDIYGQDVVLDRALAPRPGA